MISHSRGLFSSSGSSTCSVLKPSRASFRGSSFLCWDFSAGSSVSSGQAVGEREGGGGFHKVFNAPGLGTTNITPAHIPLASAQSHGHISARQDGKCSLVVPSRGGKGCGEHLAGCLAGMQGVYNSAGRRVGNESILLSEPVSE